MQTIKKCIIVLSSVGFLMTVVGVITPGWIIVNFDVHKATLKVIPVELQDEYKVNHAYQEQNPSIPDLKELSFAVGPFFIKYCFEMVLMNTETSMCLVVTVGDLISAMNSWDKNNLTEAYNTLSNDFNERMKKKLGINIQKEIGYFITSVVISVLMMIESFVSFMLTIVYTCKRYPRKALGIAGGVVSMLSGIFIFLCVVIFLIYSSKKMNIIKKEYDDAVMVGLPYSSIISILGSLLLFVSAGFLLRATLKSKDQFHYELMVIDSSRDGSTYIAKT